MMLYRKVQFKRPTVVRKGNVVKVCYLHKELGQCLGPQCYWLKIGKCPFYNKIYSKKFKKAK